MTDNIMPTLPLTTASNDGNMGMGGGWIWILLIFLLLGGRGLGGLGGDTGVQANGATNLINNDFLYSQQKIDNLGQANLAQTTQINQTLNAGFSGVQMGMCQLGHQIDSGFCATNRNIDQVRFEAAQNTCAITGAISASTQAVKDLINGNTMQDLRDRNLELASALNNGQQTAAIINNLRPYPQPSYFVAPPAVGFGAYAPYAPFAAGGCNPCNPCNPCGPC